MLIATEALGCNAYGTSASREADYSRSKPEEHKPQDRLQQLLGTAKTLSFSKAATLSPSAPWRFRRPWCRILHSADSVAKRWWL